MTKDKHKTRPYGFLVSSQRSELIVLRFQKLWETMGDHFSHTWPQKTFHGGGSEGRCRATGIWQWFVINSGHLKIFETIQQAAGFMHSEAGHPQPSQASFRGCSCVVRVVRDLNGGMKMCCDVCCDGKGLKARKYMMESM